MFSADTKLEPIDLGVAVLIVGPEIGREQLLGNVVPVAEVDNLSLGRRLMAAGEGDEAKGGKVGARHAGMIVADTDDCKRSGQSMRIID
jgi:hypothetical protein